MEIRNRIYHFEVEPKRTGKQIKALRKSKGLTAEELAEKLYCSPKTISSWETGTRFPSLDNLVDLSNIFEVSVHSLMLPDDNCCKKIDNFLTSSWTVSANDSYLPNLEDELIGVLFTREEYLTQRYLAGVFTKKDECEYQTCISSSMGLRAINSNLFSKEYSQNNAEEYFKFLKSQEERKNLFQTLFRRLHSGETLVQTIQAMNLFDRNILFTVCVYFRELRNREFVHILYHSGARFIHCDFVKNASEIEETISTRLNEKTISHRVSFVPTEIPIAEDGCIEEDLKKLSEVMFGICAPEGERVYWKPEIIEVECREELAGYFFLLDYVRDYAQTFEEYKNQVIELGETPYGEYLTKIVEEGYLQNEE